MCVYACVCCVLPTWLGFTCWSAASKHLGGTGQIEASPGVHSEENCLEVRLPNLPLISSQSRPSSLQSPLKGLSPSQLTKEGQEETAS